MSLVIEQKFLLGRFHATRWSQNPFEDPYGEWPPSPWRLLRALAARWFQYFRETGLTNQDAVRDLLTTLSSEIPSFALPSMAWRGPALKQYHPTAVEWTNKSKRAPAYKKPEKTLTEDHYWVMPETESVYWLWNGLHLTESQLGLLDQLLKRVLYFGRAESFTRLRRIAELPHSITSNCELTPVSSEGLSPVLAPIPGKLNMDALLANTDDKRYLKSSPIPPGTRWYYSSRPPIPPIFHKPARHAIPEALPYIQFVLGGQVFPALQNWIKITERFRGRVIRKLLGKPYASLSSKERAAASLMTGKDDNGRPLSGHLHTFFLLWPDENFQPTRLIVWRATPFTRTEIEAMLSTSEEPISWEMKTPRWMLRLIPLPFDTCLPEDFCSSSACWTSVTPFVPPSNRHRFRENGRLRRAESSENLLIKLLQSTGKPAPIKVVRLNEHEEERWLKLHETRMQRISESFRTPHARPGFRFLLEFSEPVSGPLMIGDSCHFGLGLFKSVQGNIRKAEDSG